ncbi:MAG: carbohydrate ABC transporter permease [Ruminiclostridium sp.]
MLISIFISFLLSRAKGILSRLKRYFILPVMLPAVSAIYLWQTIFENGSYNSEITAIIPIYLLLIWKNTGMAVLIITSALMQIPEEIIEAASLDCGSKFKIFRKISLPIIAPQLFFSGMLTFVSTLKIYKESRLYFGTDYPPDCAYTLQYYMNNHFHKLNFQMLTSATVIFTLIMTIVVVLFYSVENKISDL